MGRVRSRKSEEQEQYVLEFWSSGLEAKEWCQQNGINLNTFYHWLSKMKQSQLKEDKRYSVDERKASQEMVRIDLEAIRMARSREVQVAGGEAIRNIGLEEKPVMEIYAGSIQISITNGIHPELLSRVLSELR